MKRRSATVLVLLCSTRLCLADGLIPDSNFGQPPAGKAVELINTVDSTSLPGWRLFTSVSPARTVRFEVVADGARHPRALKMEMVYNPSAGTEGRIGFDLFSHLLAVPSGSTLRLKFQARLVNAARCGVMVTLAGHNAAGDVVSQQSQVFDPAKAFQPFGFADWTMPAEATQMNLIFNLVEPGQQVQPRDPCGVIVDHIDLEKAEK